MKKCRFCAEEIQDDAIKCRHCGEFLDGRIRNTSGTSESQQDLPWYFRTGSVVLSILTVGPFALPLVWSHPKYSLTKKIVITIIVLGITYYLSVLTAKAFGTLMKYYNGMLAPMQ